MKVAVFLNDDFSMIRFFKPLLETLVRANYSVVAMTPRGPHVPQIQATGATHHEVCLSRFESPLQDLAMLAGLIAFFKREKFDAVVNITAKPIVFGSIAARVAGVPHIVGMIEGLGQAFTETESPARFRALGRALLKLGCRLSHTVGFANPDDCKLFVERGWCSAKQARAFRSMIGVDLETFSVRNLGVTPQAVRDELALTTDSPVVMMVVARALWSKGIRQFVDAAQQLHATGINVQFVLIAPRDLGSPDEVPEEYLLRAEAHGLKWIRSIGDVRGAIAISDIVVLPSYYKEGLPRVLLEAMALEKPVITTNWPGCRETVPNGTNGILVPPRQSGALARAIQHLIDRPGLIKSYGAESRRIAESQFCATKIAKDVVARLLPSSSQAPLR